MARYTGTVKKIVDPTTDSCNTTRQSPRPHKHSQNIIRCQRLQNHFQRRPHQIPPSVSFLPSQTNTHQGHPKQPINSVARPYTRTIPHLFSLHQDVMQLWLQSIIQQRKLLILYNNKIVWQGTREP